jgi:Baseplate J-like protein
VAVVYLDPEDEITGAVARLRALPGGNVVLVLPPGSRIATSRINFRLLGREARQRDLRLATVSDEPAARAISTAAGVPAFDSVDAAEAALGQEEAAIASDMPATALVPVVLATPAPAAELGSVPTPTSTPTPTPTSTPTPTPTLTPDKSMEQTAEYVRPPRAGGRLAVEPPLYDVGDIAEIGDEGMRRHRRRSPYVAPLIAVVLLVALVGIAGYAAYLFVPTATVTLRPKLIDVGPLSMTVTADPRVAVLDAAAGLVPATEISVPVEASDTFPATGTVVNLTAASGKVRFSSQNTFVEVPVPTGTVVSTASGVEFETTEPVTVPRANFGTQTPGTATAAVVARQRGPKGNVPAGAIKRLSQALKDLLVSVRNPQATTGGSRTEEKVVTQDDYDAALAGLTAQLEPLLAAALADPATTPHGLTLYPATAQLGPAEPDQQASALVDTHAESFVLKLSASGSALAVNEDLIDQVAQSRLQQQVPAGTTLLTATINARHALGEVLGNTISFQASGVAQSWRPPDAEMLIGQISGKSVSAARTIMETYGSVEISIWPDFIDRLPDQNRIRLTIVAPQGSP